MTDLIQHKASSRRASAKLIIGCAFVPALLLLAVITALKILDRRELCEGPAVPEAKVRVQFTVAQGYSCQKMVYDVLDPGPFDVDYVYTRKQASWFQWLKGHNLPAPGGYDKGDEIRVAASRHLPLRQDMCVDKDGFVELEPGNHIGANQTDLPNQEKLLIRGCPTTMLVEDSGLVGTSDKVLFISMIVHPPGEDIVYAFTTQTYSGDVEPDLRELEAIRESITLIEK